MARPTYGKWAGAGDTCNIDLTPDFDFYVYTPKAATTILAPDHFRGLLGCKEWGGSEWFRP